MLISLPGRTPFDKLLENRADFPPSFDGNQPLGPGWYIDHFETENAQPGMDFQTAVEWLFNGRWYPEEVLVAEALFLREGRLPRPGDRIVQEIAVLPGRLHAVGVNVVTNVLHQPGRRGITVQTTTAHFEIGEMSVMVTERPGGAALLVQSVSRPSRRVPFFMRRFARRLQKAAQAAMQACFRELGTARHLPGEASQLSRGD